MAHPSVIAAVKARLAEEFTAAPIIGVNEQGSAPQDGSTFILLQFPASSTRRWSVDERYYREEGGIRFIVNGQTGIGIEEVSLLCEQLATIFRDCVFARVHTLAPGSPVFDDSNDQGNYIQAAFVAPYWFTYRD